MELTLQDQGWRFGEAPEEKMVDLAFTIGKYYIWYGPAFRKGDFFYSDHREDFRIKKEGTLWRELKTDPVPSI